jgi:hypothetical protein
MQTYARQISYDYIVFYQGEKGDKGDKGDNGLPGFDGLGEKVYFLLVFMSKFPFTQTKQNCSFKNFFVCFT